MPSLPGGAVRLTLTSSLWKGRGYWPSGDPVDLNFLQTPRFPPAVILHVVWRYFRITLSLRDAEGMLAGGAPMIC